MTPHTPCCIWCDQPIQYRTDASWTYIRSQVVLHVVNCDRRPEGSVVADLNGAVDEIMNAAFGRSR